MKRVLILLMMLIAILMFGCSSKKVSQLSFSEIENLPLEEQVKAIIDNTGYAEDGYHVVIEGNSVAVVYTAEYVSDSRLVSSDREDSFPSVAMTFVEHLEVLGLDEIVITSYEPLDTAGQIRVSALFNKDTIEELDFEKWKEEREKYPHRIYRYSDGYEIRGNIWDNLDEEIQNSIANQDKNITNSGSEFWEYYGRIVD